MPRRTRVVDATAAIDDVSQLLIDDLGAVSLRAADAVLHVDNIIREDAVEVLTRQRAARTHADELGSAANVRAKIRADLIRRAGRELQIDTVDAPHKITHLRTFENLPHLRHDFLDVVVRLTHEQGFAVWQQYNNQRQGDGHAGGLVRT